MIGTKIGDWSIIEVGAPYINPKGKDKLKRYVCTCVCSKTKLVRESSLLNGDSKGCGCRRDKQTSLRQTTHGDSKHELFTVWYDMIRRCYDNSRKDYKHYGGRGIEVCNNWRGAQGFKTFILDVYSEYQKGLELDRIDTNGNYELSNCKWSTRRDQVINRRPFGTGDAHFLEFDGKSLCMSQWAEITGISSRVISDTQS
jgi:hypothetical protein